MIAQDHAVAVHHANRTSELDLHETIATGLNFAVLQRHHAPRHIRGTDVYMDRCAVFQRPLLAA